MREIKFRAWDNEYQRMIFENDIVFNDGTAYASKRDYRDNISIDMKLMQYTGLKDKNGVEIYEFMGVDKVWEVQYSNGSYVLLNISNGDIITLYKYMEQRDGQIQVTKEYTKV